MCRESKIDFSLYEIYKDGNIFSKAKNTLLSNDNAHPYVNNELVTVDGNDMYQRHRVIWYYFNGDIPENMQVDHKNGIKTDNRLENLRLLTPYDNTHNEITYKKFLEKVRSSEHREKLSRALKGQKMSEEKYEKCKSTMFKKGHEVSDEIKNKISEANSIPVVQLTLDGEFVKEWISASKASEELGISSKGAISKCCLGGYFDKRRNKWVKQTQTRGFKWMYKSDYEKMLVGLFS